MREEKRTDLKMSASAKTLNPNEAPKEYEPALKNDVKTAELGNICRACDWRQDCEGKVRCISYELQNGMKRKDDCSVVSKKV